MSDKLKTQDRSWKTPNEVRETIYFDIFIDLVLFGKKEKQNVNFCLLSHFISFQIIRLQRLKQKQKALQARIERPAQNAKASLTDGIFGSAASKRKNPFAE